MQEYNVAHKNPPPKNTNTDKSIKTQIDKYTTQDNSLVLVAQTRYRMPNLHLQKHNVANINTETQVKK